MPISPITRRIFYLLVVGSCLLASACDAETGFVEFETLSRSDTPNDALACPASLCAAPSDFQPGRMAMPAAELAEKVATALPAADRTELVQRSEDGLRFVFVQRSLIFRFPDTVNVAVIPVDAAHADIAIYSRSNYGYGDFGVNRARLVDWAARLGVDLKEVP
ncbi:DUF1499 domain-containing protein [Dongia sp.]|uniref:DUF1499 domain-containing protein n=1 Tax=Dongia sp. TaxID=1977262 RepID=UPI0035B4CE3B